MNNIAAGIIGAVVIVVIVCLGGQLIFLRAPQVELRSIIAETENLRESAKNIESQISRLSSAKVEVKSSRSQTYLNSDTSAELMEKIVTLRGKAIKMDTFEILESYFKKPQENEDTFSSEAVDMSTVQIGDDGMPIGMAKEDEDWAGLEILPVKFSFAATYGGLGRFFSDAHRTLPVHSLRMLDLIIKENGIVKGTMVLNFPIAENSWQ